MTAALEQAEGWRTPDALLPTLFIPLFFLAVNVGQAAKIFPGDTTGFLHGQATAPSSSRSRCCWPRRSARGAVHGRGGRLLRQAARGADPAQRDRDGPADRELFKGVFIAVAIVALGMVFGIEIASRVLGFVLLVLLTEVWSVVFVGFMQIYVMEALRSLVLVDLSWTDFLQGYAVVAVCGR